MSQTTTENASDLSAPAPVSFESVTREGHEAIRAELFSLEHLETHARLLATQAATSFRRGAPLLQRFEENRRELMRAHRVVIDACRGQETVGTDAEWFADNFHIIEDALREVQVDLPRGYYSELPKLQSGPLSGFPRVYAIAIELLAHTDSGLDETNITRFVQAYQSVAPLTIGELWAVPIMLRLGLIENLRRLGQQMVSTWRDRRRADEWFGRLCESQRREAAKAESQPRRTSAARACAAAVSRAVSWTRRDGRVDTEKLSDPFIVRLLTRLRDFGPDATVGVEWLEQQLEQRDVSASHVLQRENQRQAANQVSVGNCVTSLRVLSALDWAAFFERTSYVEKILCGDPAGVYSHQDFATKDRYRQVIERMARGSGCDELTVAQRAITAARAHDGDMRRRHVGYHLIDRGRELFETELGFRATFAEWLRHAVLSRARSIYFGVITVATLLMLAALLSYAWYAGASVIPLITVALFAWLPASELAVRIANNGVTLMVPPRVLPKVELRDGIPSDAVTFVVIPSLLLDRASASNLVERLEVHYLANPDPQLRFALLTDFADAETEHMPEDDVYVEDARAAIRLLNERYGDGMERFFLFHRRRMWNRAEGCWMGWERKRGKLIEFARLLRGARNTSFIGLDGSSVKLPATRFCITLDSDTTLPRDSARRLIGIMLHPLNRARFDAERRRVVEGYGVLQPRVSFGIAAATRSWFARIFCGSAGIDPYTTAVSDVYHDLFGVGSYTGKGIFDIAAFEAAVGNTFPENHILSHDLIEGNYARCGLVSDIELFDEFPPRYDAYARREHRWVRGDWQILPWLFSRVPVLERQADQDPPRAASDGTNQGNTSQAVNAPSPTVAGGEGSSDRRPVLWERRAPKAPNPLPVVERWKIFDNLRRSLVPPATIALAAAGWLALPGSPWMWTLLVVFMGTLPFWLRLATGCLNLLASARANSLRALRGDLAHTAAHAFLSLTFLLDQSRHLADAIARTFLRLFVTRRRLLEWESAAATEKRLGHGSTAFAMWPVSATSFGMAGAIALIRPEALLAALPILVAWFVSPAVAWWVSRLLVSPMRPLTDLERQTLRRIARKTWAFFEDFVGSEDQWLPPDNYQEDPKGVVAHRTSPTNAGMLLLSTVAAHDLGYISSIEMLDRLERTFETFDRMDRFHGHFYNWYDTQTLQPLQPEYVSTVDSGNLMGCLLALKQALGAKAEELSSLPSPAVLDGLRDTWRLVVESLTAILPPQDQSPADSFAPIHRATKEIADCLASTPGDRAEWERWLAALDRAVETILGAMDRMADALRIVPELPMIWARRLARQVHGQREEIQVLVGGMDGIRDRCVQLSQRADRLAADMDFRFLYNERRHLFAVGFNVTLGRLDNAHYDLLASEASLTSLLAVARGEASLKHWFQLGRPLTSVGRSFVLVSWGGTMFEYLMPRLLLRSYPGTLLAESQRSAVARQIEYGRQRQVPWGISESGFSLLDRARDYQYQSFGVPGLGLKRGLADELVITPYATALALAVDPQEAIRNFGALAQEGAEGPYGFYEAIDYTRERMPERRRSLVVRSFMAHHQGMSLVAIANCLLGNPMPRRFHSEPIVRAVELLLQERVPLAADLMWPHSDEAGTIPPVHDGPHPMSRRLTTPDTPSPRAHLISNGRYHVMVTNSGAGSATCRGLNVTRWREDRTRDCWGQFLYVHDLRDGRTWSAAYQPTCRTPDEFEVIFSADKAEFRRLDGPIGTNLEVVVPPEDLAEIRRVTLINHDDRAHRLDVTSYVELALSSYGADLAHPAFGKLFVETEFVAAHAALLCRRRPRRDGEKPVFAVHVVALDAPPLGDVEFETDRARFIGRLRTTANPVALEPGIVLSDTTGPVLDPIFSLRRRVRVRPGASVRIAFTTAVADSREEAIALADRYHDYHAILRAFELAWAHSQVELRHLHLTGEEAHLYQRLAAQIIFACSPLRAPAAVRAANRQGQTALWRYGISGDFPIVLVTISKIDDTPTIRRLLAAHSYLGLKGLEFDLVVLCEDASGYFEELYQHVQQLVRTCDSHARVDMPGGVFIRKAAHMPAEDRVLLQAAARVIIAAARSLATQVEAVERTEALPPQRKRAGRLLTLRKSSIPSGAAVSGSAWSDQLLFWNGFGGFTRDGREYVIVAPSGAPPTPAPWVNVVANRSFGCLISESGLGFTWSENSQSNRLTPWNNDPVSDVPGEAIYLRDEESGEYWSPTPLPAGAPVGHVVRHGQGYSTFALNYQNIEQELEVYVAPGDPVKILSLKVRNTGTRRRRLSATYYAEWVLDTVRDHSAMHLVTEIDGPSGALLARNPFHHEFATRFAFADVNVRPRTFTADRSEFLGRNGGARAPAALSRENLSGRVGSNADPCTAIQVPCELEPGETKRIVFLLGQADSIEAVRRLSDRYRQEHAIDAALSTTRARWDRTLGTITVRTPNLALDVIFNRWLLYQTLACRIWGRSGFYQSSGAFGFRDQLQDIMALVYAQPDVARSHILYAAGRQFMEGDVQHWWHPPLGRGVRTRCSDDYLWLPFVVQHYVNTTGDREILDEPVPFLQAPPLRPEQEEDYGLPEISDESGSLYEHCARAVEHGLQFGVHGLPLIGTCDWNDGFNRVGHGGRGESVWNGWFLLTILRGMAETSESRGDVARTAIFRDHAARLQTAMELHAWDGRWYRRAFFDDGTPLGSEQNDECQIDSLAQSWAVISGAADPRRAAQAMSAVYDRLVQPDDRLIRLFTPPLDKSTMHPGYVKGYVPGIRENGGQYTHAATWVVQATALLGQGDRAIELFDMLNPICHAKSSSGVERYKVEPYAVAADIYGQPPHAGRGGWTWYTGSAGWLYRVALEFLLGFQLRGNRLAIQPCIPSHWPEFEISYRYQSTTYQFVVLNPERRNTGIQSITVDGRDHTGSVIVLRDDGLSHEVRITM